MSSRATPRACRCRCTATACYSPRRKPSPLMSFERSLAQPTSTPPPSYTSMVHWDLPRDGANDPMRLSEPSPPLPSSLLHVITC
uniref:Uncharacterized protein n=1 Tax=Arundo donax TaxID=35708 RepID=A0A0A9AP97_ARUDO